MENIEKQEPSSKNAQPSAKKNLLVLAILGFIVAGAVTGMYLFLERNRLYIEKSQIAAPMIDLSSKTGGKLEKLYVSSGDSVQENQLVAQVGQELIKAKDAGTVIAVQDKAGKNFAPDEAVVTMIKPSDLRVVVQVEEDKGLSEIKVGQRAFFTVDAFGAKKFQGVVDEVSPTSRQSDVVFNISSQRQINEFNVKIRFDEASYPELKNGMSAKSWIYQD